MIENQEKSCNFAFDLDLECFLKYFSCQIVKNINLIY